jgi:hypothetical protein
MLYGAEFFYDVQNDSRRHEVPELKQLGFKGMSNKGVLMNESRWLPIPEAPAYSISDQGQVRDAKGRIVAIDAGRANVFRAGLRIRINIRRAVHQLFPDVAEAALNERNGSLFRTGRIMRFPTRLV